MKKYNDILIRQNDAANSTDGSDNVQPATKVWITLAGTRTIATLYDGGDIETANTVDNPVTTDDYGRFSFYVQNGNYDFYINLNTDVEFKVKSNEPIFDVLVPSSSDIKLDSGETLQERADVRNVQALISPSDGVHSLQGNVLLKKLRADYPEFCVYTPMTQDGQYWHRWLFTNRFNLGNTGATRMINCSLAALNPSVQNGTGAANNVSETTATAPTVTKVSTDGVQTGTWVGPATVLTTTDVLYSSTVGDKLVYTIAGVERIALRGLMAGNGGIGKVRVFDAGVEIPESNYLSKSDRLISFLAGGLGNTTMHYPLAHGLDSAKTYTVEIEVDASNPAGNRVYQAGLLGYDEIAYNAVGYHGIFLDAPTAGESSKAALVSGSTVVYEVTNATKAAWRYVSSSVSSNVNYTVYDSVGTVVASGAIDAATSSLTSNQSQVFSDLTKGTYYIKLTSDKTKPALSSDYRMYTVGTIAYDQTQAGVIGVDEFDNFDVSENIADPNNGTKYMLIGSGNLELAIGVRRPQDPISATEFVGGIHAHEAVSSISYLIDDAIVDFAGAAVGDTWVGSDVTVSLNTTLLFPEDSQPFASVIYDLNLSRNGYRVGTKKTITSTCVIHNDFDIMFNCPSTAPTNQGENVGGGFELVSADKNYTINSYDNSGTFIQPKQGSVAFTNREHTAICYYTKPPEYPVEFASKPFTVGNNYCLMQDRTDRTLKWYTRSFSGNETDGVTVPAGLQWNTSKIYRVVRGNAKTLLGF